MIRAESVTRIIKIKVEDNDVKSRVCYYSDASIVFKGTIAVQNTAATNADANNTNKEVVFKNWLPFTNDISEKNDTKIDNAKCINEVMLIIL